MFFRTRPPISEDAEAWQIVCWRWLLQNLGGLSALRAATFVLPTGAFFPEISASAAPSAEAFFREVATYMDFDPDAFVLVEQAERIEPRVDDMHIVANAPSSPAGTFRIDDQDRMVITYSPDLLSKPEALVATFAHELCHPILLAIPSRPPERGNAEEFATDLAVVFFGLGIFGANSAFRFTQFTDGSTGMQGWSIGRAGYLTVDEWGFALAVFLGLRGQAEADVARYLNEEPSASFRKSLKYIRKNASLLSEISAGLE